MLHETIFYLKFTKRFDKELLINSCTRSTSFSHLTPNNSNNYLFDFLKRFAVIIISPFMVLAKSMCRSTYVRLCDIYIYH